MMVQELIKSTVSTFPFHQNNYYSNMANSNNASDKAMTGDLHKTSSTNSLNIGSLGADNSSSSLGNLSSNFSWSESPLQGSNRVFRSPLKETLKTFKSKKEYLSRKQGNGQQRYKELELDNGESLSSLRSSLNTGTKPMMGLDIFDQSIESDFDESGRWLRGL